MQASWFCGSKMSQKWSTNRHLISLYVSRLIKLYKVLWFQTVFHNLRVMHLRPIGCAGHRDGVSLDQGREGGWEGHNSTPVGLGTETEPHATRAPATGPLPGPLLISNPSLGSSPTSQLYSFECVRAVPDPEKLSREPSATEVAISLLLIGSVLTASRRKAEHL